MVSIYKYEDYRSVIQEKLAEHKSIRGYQGRLAEMAKCQAPYFSRILKGTANLNQEQALRLCLFWQFDGNETEYFLELVNFEKTDFPALKKLVKNRLDKIKSSSEDLAKRYSHSRRLHEGHEQVYYSSWYWSAIHMLVGIEGFQAAPDIASRLNLPLELVQKCLFGLESMGLIQLREKKWRVPSTSIHLPRDSVLGPINHQNWRQRAILDTHLTKNDSLHYTSVCTHGILDFQVIKETLMTAIDQTKITVREAENEQLSCICIDYFSL